MLADIEEHGGVEAFKDYAVERMNDIRRQLLEGRSAFEQKDPQVGRIAKRFALVALAGSLAVKYGILNPGCGWTEASPLFFAKACLDRALQVFQTTEGRGEALLQRLDEHRASNRAHFAFFVQGAGRGGRGAFQGPELTPLYGYVVEQERSAPGFENWGRMAFYIPTAFKEQICLPGEWVDTVQALIKHNRLRLNNGKDRNGKPRPQFVVKKGEEHPLGLEPGSFIAVYLDEQPAADKVKKG